MSVAIRTVTDLKYLDDVNITVGAGVDGYAVVWDNDTARFVLRAVTVGTFLAATGATTGATSQAQTFTNGIIGPSWKPSANSTTALQLQNATGTSILNVDTTNGRVGIGTAAPATKLEIDGSTTVNSQVVSADFEKAIYISNPSLVGDYLCPMWIRDANGASRAVIGLSNDATPHTLLNIPSTSGSKFIFTKASSLTTALAALTDGGFFGVGTIDPLTQAHIVHSSVYTNVVPTVLTVDCNSTGTVAAGFGAGQLFTLESSTTVAQSAARIRALWYEATHATRKADLVLTAYDAGGEREGLRIRGAGSEPALSFYGVPPIVRAVLATGVGATVDNVITALQNLGLVKQS